VADPHNHATTGLLRAYAMEAIGNVFAVSGAMGHADIKSMEPYQHHGLDALRSAIERKRCQSRQQQFRFDRN
jgi:hypothetical protein